MADAPKFSFVVPCYNYGHFLESALNSIFDQEQEDIQIVLVDDASTDNTPEIAAKFADRLEYVRNESNAGAGGAWRIGLEQARGRYVMKLDADDRLLPGFCSTVRKWFAKDESIGAVITSVLLNREGAESMGRQIITEEDQVLGARAFRMRLLNRFFFRVPGCMMRRRILEGHEPPDPQLYQVHDWEYLLRVTQGHKVALVSEPLAEYRIHGASITATAQQDNRLFRDLSRWMDIASQSGKRFIPAAERSLLKQSCAELILIGYDDKKSPREYFAKYRQALKLVRSAGIGALVRFHGLLIKRMFSRMRGGSGARKRDGET